MPRFRWFLLALLVSILATFAPQTAQAQGTSGQLPDPMPTTELNRLLKLYVKPDQAQMATIETLHDDYRAQFRALRESEIEKFLGEMQALQGGGVPSKQKVMEFTRKYEHINGKIAELDDNLFEAIATLMGDDHRVSVKRAKDARARARYATGLLGQMPGMGGKSVDVSAMVLESDLPAAELASLQPELISYEEHLTSTTKEMGGASLKMMVEMVDAIEKAGMGNLTEQEMMADPERMSAIMQVVQDAMAKVLKPIGEKAGEIAESNAKLYRSVHGRLTGDTARKFRVRFIGNAYPEVGGDPAGSESIFRAALRIKALDEGTRSTITDAYRSWQSADDALVDEAMKLVDKNRKVMNPMDFSGMAEGQQALMAVITKRNELGTKTLESLKSILGDDRLAKVIERRLQSENIFDETGDPEAAPAAGEEPSVAARAGAAQELEVDLYNGTFEQPIDVATIQSLVSRLEVEPGIKAAIETMHSDYLKKWTDEIEPLRAKITESQSKIWNWDQESGRPNINAEKRDAYFAARKEAMRRVLEIDDGFFHDVTNVLGEANTTEIALARLDRLLVGSAATPNPFVGVIGEAERPVNVINVLRNAEISPEERTKVIATLAPKIEELGGLLRTLRAEQIDGDREMQLMQEAQQATFTEGGPTDPAEAQRVGQRWMEVQAKLGKIADRRGAAVSGAWKAAIENLGDAAKDRLQLAYDQQAYPSIFRDSRSALPFIEKSLEMGDLTDAQRQELTSLHQRYRDEYVSYCRKMVPKRESLPEETDEQSRTEFWKRRMAEQNEQAKIRFDRDERSQRAVSQLRRILTAEQAARIGALASYDHDAAGNGAMPSDAAPD